MASRRGRSKWRNIPFDEIFGRIGLQQHGDGEVLAENGEAGSVLVRDLKIEPREPRPATKTLLDVIVENPQGSVIGQTTLDSLPTGHATLSFPFGQITLGSTAAPTTSLSIQVPGASSQQVLSSSPPPTPSPSSASSPSQPSSQLPPLSPSQTPNPSSSPAATTSPPSIPSLGASNSTFTLSTPAASTGSVIATSLGRNSTTIQTSTSFSTSFSRSSSQTGFPTSASQTSSSSSTFSTSTIGSTSSSPTSSFFSSTPSESASSTGLFATATEDGASGGPAATGTQAAPAASTTAASSGTGPVNVPVVGGVVGGLAGLAVILVLILFFLRWRRRKMAGARQLPSSADGDTEGATRPGTGGSSGPMTQRPSSGWGAAGIVPLFKKMRPHSQATTTTETAPSERGFQKISGRKLESVLVTGGDGYGNTGPSRPSERNMSGSSFYRDSQGTYGGPATSVGTSMNVGPASARQSGAPSSNYDHPGSPPDLPDRSLSASPPETVSSSPPEAVIMRPGPARQPIHQPGFSNTMPGGSPTPGLSPVPPRIRQDGIGRSHASLDGSRDSRGSRFAEDFGA